MKNKSHGVNVGSSSILLIFVLLTLISFAGLSMISANADYILCKKTAAHSNEYYDACNEANLSIASIDTTLMSLYQSGLNKDAYFTEAGEMISYLIPMNETQALQVELKVLYPETPDNGFYEISTWKVITTQQPEYDNSLDLLFE
ncbi:MAG: hypothetical protein PHT21_06920 [Lachnospiraceae bacterium]|nr:hypothetical protein [Lachnospiraceae bacterium]